MTNYRYLKDQSDVELIEINTKIDKNNNNQIDSSALGDRNEHTIPTDNGEMYLFFSYLIYKLLVIIVGFFYIGQDLQCRLENTLLLSLYSFKAIQV